MTELQRRLHNADRIIGALKGLGEREGGTVARDAAKQLSTLTRIARRYSALGKDEAPLCKLLDRAA